MPAASVTLEITFNMEDLNKTVIKTNAKREDISEILEAWLSTQVGQGRDESEANERDEYNIRIDLDLSYDTFQTRSNTGNKGLTCGFITDLLNKLDSVTIIPLS